MFIARLAGHNIEIDNRYLYLRELFKDYMADGEAEFSVSVTDEEIEKERIETLDPPKSYLESLAVYRKICEKLLFDDIVLFHCSALSFEGKAILFTAPSGTGKSTHAALWRKKFGSLVTMINDDKPLLKIGESGVTVFGTPFGGKENIQTNMSAEAAAVVILRQEKENSIRRLTFTEAFPTLLNQTYRVKTNEGFQKTLELFNFFGELPVYSLGCNISIEAVDTVYNALKNDGILP
ncbi:MAG: hypothetical protein K6F09_02765 [Clostridiales bacterium]|nr:hypothetical protein [Clostridiales bacterium]